MQINKESSIKRRIMNIKYFSIALVILLSGCITSSTIIETDTIPKIHIHQWDKQTGKCWICGVIYSPMKVKSTQTRLKNSKQTMINALMIENGLSEPEATILWENYKKYKISPNKRDFANYLIETNPYQKIDRLYIDFVERVKVRTKILKRNK